jgi:hypothetical protein
MFIYLYVFAFADEVSIFLSQLSTRRKDNRTTAKTHSRECNHKTVNLAAMFAVFALSSFAGIVCENLEFCSILKSGRRQQRFVQAPNKHSSPNQHESLPR